MLILYFSSLFYFIHGEQKMWRLIPLNLVFSMAATEKSSIIFHINTNFLHHTSHLGMYGNKKWKFQTINIFKNESLKMIIFITIR